MKIVSFILLLLLGFNSVVHAQSVSPEIQKQIDSLNLIINDPNSKDTTLALAYLELAFQSRGSKMDTIVAMCIRAKEIAEKGLELKPEAAVRSTFLTCLAGALNNIGYFNNIDGEAKKALENYEASLQIHDEIGDRHGAAACLINIGKIYENQGSNEKGLTHYRKALKIQEEINDKAGMATSLNNIGYIYYVTGDIEKGLDYWKQSLKIRREIEDKYGEAMSLYNIGFVYKNKADITKALEYWIKGLKIREELGNKRDIAQSLNGIGLIYRDLKDYNMAIEYNNRSLKLRLEIGDKRGIAISYNNLAVNNINLGHSEIGMDYYHKSLKIEEELGNKRGIAYGLNNIAYVYDTQGDWEKALKYNLMALKMKEEINDKQSIVTSLHNIGWLYFKRGKTLKAKTYTAKSLVMARELGFPDEIKSAAEVMSKIFKKEKNWREALKMYELFIQMRDSIQNERNEKATIKQNMQYEYDKKAATDSIKAAEQKKVLDAQIIAQEAKISQEKMLKYSLFGGFGLVLLFSIFIVNRLFVTRKQKEEIEIKNLTLNEKNEEIAFQKEQVEDKNKQILDSIIYAERIQSAILPPISLVKEYLKNSFVLYKPKDIVAGDFYWLEKAGDDIFFSAADCTGHGVPGAMMSVMCSNALTKCVKELELESPALILDETSKIIEGRFERSEQLVLDGMDLALCKLNVKTKKMQYAGANNPLWVFREEELIEIKPDKQPIGQYEFRKPYTNHSIELKTGDTVYIFSDGYIDQFGGDRGKKYKAKSFKKLLKSIQKDSIEKQKELINQAFDEWKGELEQVDDVCVIGVKI